MPSLQQQLTAIAVAILVSLAPAAAQDCKQPDKALGVSRIVEIDASAGPLFGDMSKLGREDSFLKPKEVVLTFDDGPLPWITKSILDTLDTYCTKATFFNVGQMALAYPNVVKEVIGRGHTVGAHTWSHPLNIVRLGYAKAVDQIERGFAAVELAAGQPIAPFFRFPGLSDSNPLLHHLQTRGIATFTVDIVSNDSYIGDNKRLAQRTLREVERRQGGIILFHDIKASTAHALPEILAGLKNGGFTIVHMRAKEPVKTDAALAEGLRGQLAKNVAAGGGDQHLIPFYGAASTIPHPEGRAAAVETIAPAAETRVAAVSPDEGARGPKQRPHAKRVDTADGDEKPAQTRTQQKKAKSAKANTAGGLGLFGF